METLNVSDALLPSAGPNPALFRVELKKGEVGFGFNISGGQEYGTQVRKRNFSFLKLVSNSLV